MRMTRLQRLRARVAGQAGFTLVELLVGMTIGMVVVFAAFTLMERSFVAANDIADRADAAQRGRIAMDAVTRQLRSQVCFSGQLPLLAGSANSIDFVTDLGDGTTSPERHVLTFRHMGHGAHEDAADRDRPERQRALLQVPGLRRDDEPADRLHAQLHARS
jgi:prepilin-type N-terminal cleavage/methylation domain-containing protein